MNEQDAEELKAAATATEDKKKHSNDGPPSMHVKVYSPFKVYFDDEADSLSGENATGPFDILPKHHNFITLLTPCILYVKTKHAEEKIRISGGLMHVKADKVIVFLDV